MIAGFWHRGLRRYFESGDVRGLHANHLPKIRRILARLEAATSLRDIDAPGLRLHQLKGKMKGRWAVDVDRNWRVTFGFDGRDCHGLDHEDYH